MNLENSLTIVMYHYVRPIKNSRYPEIKGLEIEGFRRQLDYFLGAYTLITAEQLVAYSLGKLDLPPNSCLLTFDDGYKDHIQYVMPELLAKNIQGSFFPPVNAIERREMLDVNAIHFILAAVLDFKALMLELDNICFEFGLSFSELNSFKNQWAYVSRHNDPPEVMYVKNMLQHVLPKNIRSQIVSILFNKYVGRSQAEFADELYMSLSDIKALIDNGMYVGGHGCEHIWLDKASYAQQSIEIKQTLSFLAKVGSSIENWIMCYPYGSYNEDTLNLVRESKCAIGLTTKTGYANLNQNNMLELNRFDTNDYPQ